MSRAMGSHQSHRMGTDVWLTPPHVLDALGPFDLDPCSSLDRPWGTATRHYTIEDDGLAQDWAGRVWCNPPYGQQAWTWLERLADHGRGTALIFARTETAGFFRTVWRRASALLFLEGRLHFHHPDGTRAPANAGAPSVLVAYGDDDAHRLATCGLPGAYVDLRPANTHHGHRRNPTHQHRATKEDTMSITEKRLDEIRERLDAAEYPDHEHLTICGREGTKVVWVEQSSVDGSVMAGGSVAEVDAGPRTAEMFLNAPQDLSDLLAEVERLREELAKAREVTEEKVGKGGVAANDVGWTCYGGAHEPGSYHECPECKKVSDQLARCVLTAALGGGDDE